MTNHQNDIRNSRSIMIIGMNPAEIFAVVLMVHHDRDTLAWSDTEVTPYVVRDRDGTPIADPRLTSDPPPWWRAHKKNALFYNGMARGDHRGTMALATSVCVDDVARAAVVDEQFRHIQAYLATIRAPAYPRAIDAALAEEGRPIFTRDCAGCHVDLPAELVMPTSHVVHEGDFVREHGARAASARDLCATCHGDRFCASCHGAGLVAALPARLRFEDVRLSGLHRAGFAARHADEARADPGLCTTCHAESTCRTCPWVGRVA